MIHLTIPPTPESMGVLRTTAGAAAARAPLTIDQVDDVRMGVEEAAMLLLAAGVPVTMSVDPSATPFELVVSVPTSAGLSTNPESLSWMVLRGVTDQVDLHQAADRTELILRFDPVTADA